MFSPSKPLKIPEFVTLLAVMVSILALSTDAMLPALGGIATELKLTNPNDAQLVITAMFLGFAIGQIVAGPLSDCYGRKPVIYFGYVIFIGGCVLSIFAENFAWMLTGRVLQGLGAAAPRIVSIALVRDGYDGRLMARIMSIVMAIFIVVPAIAPAIGQFIMQIAHWRYIFWLLLFMAVFALIWFAGRQPETLSKQARRNFSFSELFAGIAEAFTYRALTGYTLATGLIFGAFLGYLNSAQQVFQTTYVTGDWFAVYFGLAALAIGASSIFNAKLVVARGMRYMTMRALAIMTLVSVLFVPLVIYSAGVPHFWLFMAWLVVSFFCVGILFGNLNALAMEPVGHMAGLGAAIIGSVSTFISLPLGWWIGAEFDGTVLPLVAGFALLGASSYLVMVWTEKGLSEA